MRHKYYDYFSKTLFIKKTRINYAKNRLNLIKPMENNPVLCIINIRE